MTTVEPNPRDLGELRRTLRARLEDFGRKVRTRLLVEAAAHWFVIAVGALLLTFVLDRTLRLSLFTRRGLLLAFVALVVVQAWRRLLAPMRMKLDADLLAAALEKKAGLSIASRVATVLELPAQMDSSKDATSAVMVERAVRMSDNALAGVDFESHFDDRRRKVALGTIGGVAAFSLLLVLLFPSSAWLWARRLFAGSNEPWPQRTQLEIAGVKDGILTVPRGEPFALRVVAKAGSVPPESISIRWSQGGGSRVNAMLTKFGENDFRYDFPPIDSQAQMELAGGDDRVGPMAIRPVDRPRFIELALSAKHPTDPAPKVHNFAGSDAGDLAFLPKTELTIRFSANTPIEQVKIRSSTTMPSEANLRRLNERQFAITWEHAAAVQTELELVSADVGLVSVPTNLSIGLKNDAPPRVTLGFSGVRQRVTPQATIPLLAEARDDFGIDKIELNVRTDLSDSEDPAKVTSTATTQPVFGPATQPTEAHAEVRQPHEVSVAALKLEPGHLLTFCAAATDTCYIGAQVANSRPIGFRIVRPEDLFKEILLRQQAERAKYRKQIEESRKVRESLASPLTPQSITELAGKHRDVQREVSRIQGALSDSLIEMRLNVLGTPEAHELMHRLVLEPMKGMDAELMRPQRDGLEVLRPDDANGVASAIERQEQIIQRLEDILRAMSQWDSFIDVLNQLNEIIRVQNQVRQNTGQLRKDQAEGVFEP